jgi:hypothetical protein
MISNGATLVNKYLAQVGREDTTESSYMEEDYSVYYDYDDHLDTE